MKICAMMSVGNDREFFRATLDSIYWFFDEIHVVFGSFGHTRHLHDSKTGLPLDGTAELLCENIYPDPKAKVTCYVNRDGFKSWGDSYNYVLGKIPPDTDWVMHVNSGDLYLQEDLDYIRERVELTDKRVIYWPIMHFMRTLRWINVAGEELRLFRYSSTLRYDENPVACGGILLDDGSPVWHLGPSGGHCEYTDALRTIHTCHARSPLFFLEKIAMLQMLDRVGMGHESVVGNIMPAEEDYASAAERLRRTSGFLYFTDPEFKEFDVRVAEGSVPGFRLYEGPYPSSLQRHPRFGDEVIEWWKEHPEYRGRGGPPPGMPDERARRIFDAMLQKYEDLREELGQLPPI